MRESLVTSSIGRVLVALALLVPALGLHVPATAQSPKTAPVPVIDLARTPPLPSDLPEEGFGLAQGGPLDASNPAVTVGGLDATVQEIGAIERHMVRAHSQVLVRLSDPADRLSDWEAVLITLVVVADDEAGVAELRDALARSSDPATLIGDITVTVDSDSVATVLSHAEFLIFTLYGFPDGGHPNWSREELARLTELTADRIDRARELAEGHTVTLGTGNIWVTGSGAAWSRPTVFDPVTEHYRVLDGRLLPYAGEGAGPRADPSATGVHDLFRSYQSVGDGNDGLSIAVTLARFETLAAAEAFAADPDPLDVEFSSDEGTVWSTPERLDDETMIARGSRNAAGDAASGYRTVRTTGDMVQIVEVMGWGEVAISQTAVENVTAWQTACTDALPDPCATLSRLDLEVTVPGGRVPGSERTAQRAIRYD